MSQKITEKEVAYELLNSAHVLVTQPVENTDGNTIESLRRIPLSVFFSGVVFNEIEITSISNSIGTVEMGSTVESVTINWVLNKAPISQTLNGETVDTPLRSVTLEGLALTAETAYTVKVTDERDASASGTTRIYFYNGVYYGVLEDGAALDSAAILGLKKKLQSGKTLTFTADAGASQRIAYALPSRYGTPNFNVGGFDGGFTKAATVDFTNASGYTESYDVWLSDNTGLGSTTVKVT